MFASHSPLVLRRRLTVAHRCVSTRRPLSPAVYASAEPTPKGKCYFVSAGPGGVDLLTVKGMRILQSAQVVIADDLASEDILALAPEGAHVVHVGKRGGREDSWKQPDINEEIVKYILEGRDVVRLKGGCASTFSRITSELLALEAEKISYEIVPGVSSVLAAPLLAGFPLTDKDLSRCYAVVSAHSISAVDPETWRSLSSLDTLVILMGGRNIRKIVEILQVEGKPTTTPIAIIREAALPTQTVFFGTLGTIETKIHGQDLSPCIIVVGPVVDFRHPAT